MHPRLILILCEGKTEKLYFDIVIQKRRVRAVDAIVFGQKGVHESLIKRCANEKKRCAKEFDIEESEVEVWAVCDSDGWRDGYQKLLNFAKENGVHLAFSDPQFETYLVQHFGLKRTNNKKKKLELELSGLLGYKYDKANLVWLDEMIDNKPTILDMAIKNADKFNKHSKSPFLTVQNLTRRLLEFAL